MKSPMLPFVESFSRKEKILLSMSDTNVSIFPDEGFPCLMTHENKFLKLAGNRLPWAFGISEEILEKTKSVPPFEARKHTILRNFRPSANQDIRNLLDLSFVEILEKHLPVDRFIGNDHFERLLGVTGCIAYGGAISVDYNANPYYAQNDNYKYCRDRSDYKRPTVIVRWDSWRFWESLASGCLTFQLDFEKYGFLLPEMPEPWKHYIPVDIADPAGSVERFMDSRRSWAEIAHGGRAWALEHYSPAACAQRLLGLLCQAG